MNQRTISPSKIEQDEMGYFVCPLCEEGWLEEKDALVDLTLCMEEIQLNKTEVKNRIKQLKEEHRASIIAMHVEDLYWIVSDTVKTVDAIRKAYRLKKDQVKMVDLDNVHMVRAHHPVKFWGKYQESEVIGHPMIQFHLEIEQSRKKYPGFALYQDDGAISSDSEPRSILIPYHWETERPEIAEWVIGQQATRKGAGIRMRFDEALEVDGFFIYGPKGTSEEMLEEGYDVISDKIREPEDEAPE